MLFADKLKTEITNLQYYKAKNNNKTVSGPARVPNIYMQSEIIYNEKICNFIF